MAILFFLVLVSMLLLIVAGQYTHHRGYMRGLKDQQYQMDTLKLNNDRLLSVSIPIAGQYRLIEPIKPTVEQQLEFKRVVDEQRFIRQK